jgi:hypothetical protein
MIQRNRPVTTLLLALPLALLARCTSTSDDSSGNGPEQIPDPPVVQCTTVEQCELPRSICAGPGLVYYTNARCEADGQCAWDEMTTECGGSHCSNGGCVNPTMTAGGSPPFDPCTGPSGSTLPECAGGSGGSGEDDDGGSVCDADDDGGPGQCVP